MLRESIDGLECEWVRLESWHASVGGYFDVAEALYSMPRRVFRS